MLTINKNIIIFWILFFLPMTYIIGIAITEIFFFVLIIWFFFQKDIKTYFLDKKFLFLIIFSVYIGINSLFQIGHQDLLYSSISYSRFALFALVISILYEKFHDLPKKEIFINIAFIFYLFIFADSFFQFFTGYNFFGYEVDSFRVSSFFGDELILGGFLLKLLPLFIWSLIYTDYEFKKNSVFLIFFFFLYFSVIYIAGGRTAIGLMIISIFYIILFSKNFKKIFIISSILLIFFIVLTLFFNIGKSNIGNRVFLKTYNEITNNIIIQEDQKKDGLLKKNHKNQNFKIFSRDHEGHYILALDLFKKNYIFGVGPRGFRYHCRKIDYNSNIGICTTHPHNILMQFLSELGIIGLLFYLTGLSFILRIFFKAYKDKNINLNAKDSLFIASLGVFVNFFPFLPSGNFFNNWISIISFYSIGVFFYSYKKFIIHD